ncbi:MAG: hypothetical protein HFH88_11405 [Lachnospiraceae bacterium]|nr:hypothetical protein [Lachnospiraceae bacterium]
MKARSSRMVFDPQTTLWTDTPVETILREDSATKYSDMAAVNPNAGKNSDSGHVHPYGKGKLSDWAYSEYLWSFGYPVGNGRMAAMVSGGIDREVIQVNEDTIWDGSPYAVLVDEDGNVIDHVAQVKRCTGIYVKNPTSGSVDGSWRYYRGMKPDGTPADTGTADAIVGDSEFRTKYPQFEHKSVSNQALYIENVKTQEAAQARYQMERMVENTMLGNPMKQKSYKSFVELYFDFSQDHRKAENYTKSLDLNTGIVSVEYDYDGAHYIRETLASYPDQTIATRIGSDVPLKFRVILHTYHNESEYCRYEKINNNEIKLVASVTDGNKDGTVPGGVNAIRFEARLLVQGEGKITASEDGTAIEVEGGKHATVYVVGASNYENFRRLDNTKPERECQIYVENIRRRNYEEIKKRHVEDFGTLFMKSSLSLKNKEGVDRAGIPTEKRIRKPFDGKSGFLRSAGTDLTSANAAGIFSTYADGDYQLATLEFNFGKYLLISGSRDGRPASGKDIKIRKSQPLNLTGKWNAAMSAAWNGKYTININTEMNYWAAQILGLAQCERPLTDVIAELAESGAITAKYQYAITNLRGDEEYRPGDPWVMHHNFDLWRGTQPIDNATAGLWPTGGAWLLEHAWEYYKFTCDREYLEALYPSMKGAAAFFVQFLVTDPVTGYLITAAACSPEQGGVQPGPAMDMQLVRNLYDMVRSAAKIIGRETEDAKLLEEIEMQMPKTYFGDEPGKVAPDLIDEHGLIKEWTRGDSVFDLFTNESSGEYQVTNPFTGEKKYVNVHVASNRNSHKHCSHLWDIYPGTHLSSWAENDSERRLYNAFCASVAARGASPGTGWGIAWRIALNARARNGNFASDLIEQLITARTSPNLFDQHPNFQVDGNFGVTAGILELLLQSHDGIIDILPSLPEKWKEGEFEHFKARGNIDVSVKWTEGIPWKICVVSENDARLVLGNKHIGDMTVRDYEGVEIVSEFCKKKGTRGFNAKAGVIYSLTIS